MNIIDSSILHFLNSFAQRSALFDRSMTIIVGSNLIKGGVIVTLLWWAWFKSAEANVRRYQLIIAALAGSSIAILLARAMALLLPFRTRPLHTPELNWVRAIGMDNVHMEDWSSFPSDHAALFFGLSAGLFLISRRVGLFALLYSLLVIALPRVYLGIHFPSDILVGAALGIGTVYLLSRPMLREWVARLPLFVLQRAPGLFYAGFFLYTYEMVTLFDSARTVLRLFFGLRQI